MKKDILKKLDIEENHELECKLAEGGLPNNLWETYSSFANTEGGTILLGIKEHRECNYTSWPRTINKICVS